MKPTIVWVVTQHIENRSDGHCSFDICGVFSDEEQAVAACKDWRYGVIPLELNKAYPEETVEVPGAYYPIKVK
jgi:hypothetical protein